MAIRKIAKMGNPVLHQVAAPVDDPTDPEIARLAGERGISALEHYPTLQGHLMGQSGSFG